ncbi:formate/nitrite transporter family protein [Methanospirillum sp.]|uniref:formate/nitrite transporter family protein n=1 Tax=Methanospirillum sp. TaxID=45200 RepID=UPI00359FF743
MTYHTPSEIIVKGIESGKYRMSLPGWNILIRGWMAGAYIAMGASLMIIVSTGVASALGAGIAQLLSGFVFPLGLILVVLTGAELFTGDAMLAPFTAFSSHCNWNAVFRLWILSYIGNVIGAVFFACLLTFGVLLQPGHDGMTASTFAVTMVTFASERCSYQGINGARVCFIKAVAAGWLINLAVLLGICADDAVGKIAGIWFPSMALASTGFEHSITNAALVPAGLLCAPYLTFLQVAQVGPLAGNLGWSTFLMNNLIPATAGNLFGGLVFSGFFLWIVFKKEIIR